VAFAVLACIAGLTVAPPARAAGVSGTYLWPVTGNVIRWFEPPSGPYSAGHRGIDIAAPFGTPIQAPADGTVTFSGWVAGSLFLTIDHGNGVKTSYSWLSGLRVAKGDSVKPGQIVALTGHGHPDVPTPHLHFSVRINGVYVNPMLLLGYPNLAPLIRLAPIPLPP
jgi:murein DD-endopeptidase MepM/ murein hydrolase activator NlpD